MAEPFVALTRQDWAALADDTEIDLDQATLERLRGLGDPTDKDDVVEVYRPLTQLLHLHMSNTGRLYEQSNQFLRQSTGRTPFVIGVAGSVAVGKSTVSRLLRELLSRAPGRPRVDLVTTDGFLYPNAELQRRGLLTRKGFPESYDRRALLEFVAAVKSGASEVSAPVYSHHSYDITGEHVVVRNPDVLIIEGLNVLQPARAEADGQPSLAVSDFFDFSVYVDAEAADIRRWFTERFMTLRDTAFRDPTSFFTRFTQLSTGEALSMAHQIWDSINGPNLVTNIEPTRGRATAILRKGADHGIERVLIRKV
ncbi:MAG: type I pantothenate kinase [Propionibacteriaceae bacterium]|nr:type I pantothenate kinase [Propionibacteriaceae bacterium]